MGNARDTADYSDILASRYKFDSTQSSGLMGTIFEQDSFERELTNRDYDNLEDASLDLFVMTEIPVYSIFRSIYDINPGTLGPTEHITIAGQATSFELVTFHFWDVLVLPGMSDEVCTNVLFDEIQANLKTALSVTRLAYNQIEIVWGQRWDVDIIAHTTDYTITQTYPIHNNQILGYGNWIKVGSEDKFSEEVFYWKRIKSA